MTVTRNYDTSYLPNNIIFAKKHHYFIYKPTWAAFCEIKYTHVVYLLKTNIMLLGN
jgi:hypothetical protein